MKKGAGESCGLLPKCLAQDGCIVEAEVPQLSAALIKKHAGTEWASICREVLVIWCITHRVAGLLCVCLLRITGPHSCRAGAVSADCSLEWAG